MVDVILNLVLVLMAIAAGCTTWRLIKGPHVLDRLLAVDKLTYMIIGYLVFELSITSEKLYTEAAIAVALFSFVLVAFLANYLTELAQR